MRRNSRLTAIVGFAAAAILLPWPADYCCGGRPTFTTRFTSQLSAQQVYFPPASAPFAHAQGRHRDHPVG